MKRVLLVLLGVILVAWTACSNEQLVREPDTLPVPAAPGSAASTTPRVTDRFPTAKGDLAVSPLEHSSVLFGWDGKAVYVDPVSTAIADETLPQADVVVVTEARFDHLDGVAIARLAKPGTVVVGPPAVAEKTRVDVVLNNGDARTLLGIGVTAVPLYSLERGPAPGRFFHEKGRGNGYVLDFGGTRVYVSGDTECTPETKALERIDVAFVSVSAPTAMTPAEAAQCIEAFHPRVVFPYDDRRADLRDLEHALAGRGIDVRERQFYPRAEHWRLDALRACGEGEWGVCRDRLDLAKALDPQSEADPRVVHAREQVEAWRSPFPAWW